MGTKVMRDNGTSYLLIILLATIILFVSVDYSFGQNYDEMSLTELLDVKIDVASSRGQTILNTPSTVSIIDQKMIKQYNFNSVAEALCIIPGFQVMRTYFKRNIPTSRDILQPHYANKVLVLINGIPQWNAATGETNIDRININDVERIEVLKGPASVLYGTNAYTGAINIVIKNSELESSAVHLAFGSNGRLQAGGNINLINNDWKTFISANTSDEAGHDYLFKDEDKVEGFIKEYLKENNFNLLSKYKGHTFLFNTYITHESYLGNTPTFATGAGKDQVLNGYLLSYGLDHSFSEKLNVKYNLSYDYSQRNFAGSLDGVIKSHIEGYRITNKANLNYSISENYGFDLDADYDIRKSLACANYNELRDSVIDFNNMAGKKLYEFSLAAQAYCNFGAFNLVAGSRITWNELFGNNLSSRATLVYALDDNNSFKLIAGQSYRAPSLFELYFETPDNQVFGNINLKPETSNSIEIAYLSSIDNFFVQALVYFSSYQNKAYRVRRFPNDPTNYSVIYINGNEFTGKGVELEFRYSRANLLDAFLNYSYSTGNSGDEVNNSGHYNFRYNPAHTISFGLAKDLSDVTLSLLSNYRSRINSLLGEIKPSITFDFNIRYNQKFLNGTLSHNLSAKNLFNETVMFPEYNGRNIKEVPSGYGRRIYYELQYSL